MSFESKIPNKVCLERSVFEQFIDYTFRNSEFEWGGLLLGKIFNGNPTCLAAILPPQTTQSSGYCEFRKEIFPAINLAIEDLKETYGEDFDYNIIAWIHTHPNLDVFLSKTDCNTFYYLTRFNPALTAIVVDPVHYTWLAVNSKPGTTYGYTKIDLDLNYLYKFDNGDQRIIKELESLSKQLNKLKYRKIARLQNNEKIIVYIPVPFSKLKHNLIISNLNTLKDQIDNTKQIFFGAQLQKDNIVLESSLLDDTMLKSASSKFSDINSIENIESYLYSLAPNMDPSDFNKKILLSNSNEIVTTQNIIKSEKEKSNPEINYLTEYLSKFREIENDLKTWKYFELNRELYRYNIENLIYYMKDKNVEKFHKILDFLETIHEITSAKPLQKLIIRDQYLYLEDKKRVQKIKWNSINSIIIDDLNDERFAALKYYYFILIHKKYSLKPNIYVILNPRMLKLLNYLDRKFPVSIRPIESIRSKLIKKLLRKDKIKSTNKESYKKKEEKAEKDNVKEDKTKDLNKSTDNNKNQKV
ncbi:MAG: hypothetical protein ACTSRP_10260 [Candidatus Helarchaeota archaeon]